MPPSYDGPPSHLSFALPAFVRETTDFSLAALYFVAAMIIFFSCLGCGIFRTRRRDALIFRSLQRAQLSHVDMLSSMHETHSPHRRAGKTIRVYSFRATRSHSAITCPVCLEPLANLAVSQGVCRHPLHTSCLVQWLMRDPHLSCPVCRSTFQSVTPKCPRSVQDEQGEQGDEQRQTQVSVSLSSRTEVGDAVLVNATAETIDVLEEAPDSVGDVARADTQCDLHQCASATTTTNTTQQAIEDVSTPLFVPQSIDP